MDSASAGPVGQDVEVKGSGHCEREAPVGNEARVIRQAWRVHAKRGLHLTTVLFEKDGKKQVGKARTKMIVNSETALSIAGLEAVDDIMECTRKRYAVTNPGAGSQQSSKPRISREVEPLCPIVEALREAEAGMRRTRAGLIPVQPTPHEVSKTYNFLLHVALAFESSS